MYYVIELAGYFCAWTCLIYWLHRAAHQYNFLWRFHRVHHAEERYTGAFEFSWWNLVGWFDDGPSTIDQWLTEIVPTIMFVAIFPDAWPILAFYWIDNALAEGLTDHNPRVDVPLLAMGRYHLRHHRDHAVNFDVYTRLWDFVFGTMQSTIESTRGAVHR